jgi:hypothetical protein
MRQFIAGRKRFVAIGENKPIAAQKGAYRQA